MPEKLFMILSLGLWPIELMTWISVPGKSPVEKEGTLDIC